MRVFILSLLTIVGISSMAYAEDRAELVKHDAKEYLCGIQVPKGELEVLNFTDQLVTIFQARIFADSAKEALKLFGNKYTSTEDEGEKLGLVRVYHASINPLASPYTVKNIWCTNDLL